MQKYLEPRKISLGYFCQNWCRALSCEFWKLACPKLTCVCSRVWWVYVLHIEKFWLGSLPSSGRDHNHTSFLVSSSCRLLVLACLVSLWALGSSSWKKAKISGTHRAGMSGERGQSGLQRRLWGIWVETAGAEGHLLTAYGCELTAFRLAGRVQSLGRWKEHGQQRKCLSHVEKKISAMPETQTVNPSLKVFPACTQLWVFFSSSKRPPALKLYRNSQLKPHQDRFLGLEWGT